MQSTNGEPLTITFDSLDIHTWSSELNSCLIDDYVEVKYGSSTFLFCGPHDRDFGYGTTSISSSPVGFPTTEFDDCPYCGGDVFYTYNWTQSIPGPITIPSSEATDITIKFHTDFSFTAHGFFAVICCSVTDMTGDEVTKYTIISLNVLLNT